MHVSGRPFGNSMTFFTVCLVAYRAALVICATVSWDRFDGSLVLRNCKERAALLSFSAQNSHQNSSNDFAGLVRGSSSERTSMEAQSQRMCRILQGIVLGTHKTQTRLLTDMHTEQNISWVEAVCRLRLSTRHLLHRRKMSCEIALGLFQEREKASMVFWTYTSKTDEKRP
jgi:hypothetical protein